MAPTVGFDISALDQNFKAHAHRGIGRYVRELRLYFETTRDLPIAVRNFQHNEFHGSALIERAIAALPFGRQTVRQQLVYPRALSSMARECQVLHFPAHMDAPAWGAGLPTIVTVLDLIPLVCADLYRRGRANWRFKFGRFLELRAIQNASLIIAISECTANDVVRLLGVPRERIVVTPLGVQSAFFDRPHQSQPATHALRARIGLGPQDQALLYVGGIDPRKNWPMLLETHAAVVRTRREKGARPPVLLVAGRISNDDQYPAFVSRMRELGIESEVRLLDYVSDDDLFALYGMCHVFFFPSLYEGFGLTVLEALAAGLPVVSSNRSSMPEVAGDAAVLVDPQNRDQCVRALLGLLDNEERRRDLTVRGPLQAKKFTWQRTGEETIRAYEQCIRESCLRGQLQGNAA